MSQSGKVGQKNPGGTNVDALVTVEQRPMWVPISELTSFARFQRFVQRNTPFGAGVPSAGEQAHWTLLLSYAGITMGN